MNANRLMIGVQCTTSPQRIDFNIRRFLDTKFNGLAATRADIAEELNQSDFVTMNEQRWRQLKPDTITIERRYCGRKAGMTTRFQKEILQIGIAGGAIVHKRDGGDLLIVVCITAKAQTRHSARIAVGEGQWKRESLGRNGTDGFAHRDGHSSSCRIQIDVYSGIGPDITFTRNHQLMLACGRSVGAEIGKDIDRLRFARMNLQSLKLQSRNTVFSAHQCAARQPGVLGKCIHPLNILRIPEAAVMQSNGDQCDIAPARCSKPYAQHLDPLGSDSNGTRRLRENLD